MRGPGRRPRVNEAVGAFVLVALGLFVAAVLQAGVLGPLLRPALTLRVILPPEGTAGLSAGAPVEGLGTRAGQVRRIVIDPRQQLYADVRLDQGMDVFVRRDSRVFIRRQFGVAGAAFLEISRGTGAPLDWDYAVLEVTREQAPTESLGELIEDLRNRLVPVFEDVGRITRAAADISEKLARGEGSVGRLLADYHRRWPLRRGMPREEVKSRLSVRGRAADAVLQTLAIGGAIADLGSLVALPSHQITLSPDQQRQADAYRAALAADPVSPPAPDAFGIDADLLAAMVELGMAVRIAEGIVYGVDELATIEARVREIIDERGSITLAEFRDAFGTSRKYAQAVLEYLDQQRVTRRVGDARVRGTA